jgi:hypothetical protein
MPRSASIACSFNACSFKKNMSQRTIRSQAFFAELLVGPVLAVLYRKGLLAKNSLLV